MVETTLLKSGVNPPKTLLKDMLSQKESEAFDDIIIDCPPSLGFLSLNALCAAENLLIPMQCEYFALDSLARLLSTVAMVQREDNPSLEIMGILLTMVDSRTSLHLEIAKEVRSQFKDHVFTTTIPRNISIPEAISKGVPVNLYKPGSAGSLSYAALAREVIEYLEKKKKVS